MAKVELNIVAIGDFTSINTEINRLRAQVDLLNKSLVGVGLNSNLTKQLQEANNAFKSTMLSSGQFSAATVKLQSETEKFGQSLVTGKLKLSEYFNIIKTGSANATGQMKALAIEQTKLQNSIVMSDPTKQGMLSVYTPTKINEVANATKIATNMQNLYNIAVNKGTQSLINWGKNTQWAGRQLTVGMTVPLTIFGATAMKTFQQVNDELVRLQKVYGTGLIQPTQEALAAIKTQVLDLSKELASTLGIAAKDTAAMAADIAATGVQGADLINSTREALRLQKLGEMDQQSAMQTTISLRNVYKLSTDQLSGAINFLNAVENQTSTSLQDLAAGIPKVGPIVQQLGGSFKDTAVMMVAMKEAGVPAAQSANAIKSALASLINPTKNASEAFAKYNIDVGSIAKKTGGNPIEMIMMLQNSLKGLDKLAQAQLIEKLFGKFQEARIQALITNLGAVNSQTKAAFDLAKAGDAALSGIAQNELKTATESVTGKYQRAVQTLKVDLIPVGEKIMQIATKLLDFGDKVSKVFAGLPGPVKTVMGILALGVALSGPIIMLTGVVANFVGYLMKGLFAIKSLRDGTKTFGELFTPEIIASQNAAALFSDKILQDESAVMLLDKAVKELTISLEGMAAAMNASSTTSFASSVMGVEAGLAGGRIPFRAPGKFAQGIEKVPGSGSEDTYPAMLTPGESIIPADKAKRYAPFISAMINGTLPGFAGGVEGYSPGGTPQYRSSGGSRSINQMVIAQNKQLAEARAVLKSEIHRAHAAGEFAPGSDQYNELAAKYPQIHDIEKKYPGSVKVESDLTADLGGSLNVKMRKGNKGATQEEFAQGYDAVPGGGHFVKAASRHGISKSDLADEEVRKTLKDFSAAVKQRIVDTKKTLITDADFEKATRDTIDDFQKMGGKSAKLATALDKASKSIGEARVNVGKSAMVAGIASGEFTKDKTIVKYNGMGVGNARNDGTFRDRQLSVPGGYKARAGSSNAAYKEFAAQEQKNIATALNQASDSHSASRETKKATKNIVDGVTETIKAAKPAVAAAVEQGVVAPTIAGEEMAAGGASGGFRSRLKGKFINSEGKMNLQTKMGGASALMMAGPMLAGMLPQGSNASKMTNSVTSMAGMGMMFGPWGAAAGAAIGLVTSGIGALMRAEKEHQAVAKASFTASAESIKLFGGSTLESTTRIIHFSDKIKEAGITSQKTLTEIDNLANAIAKLGKDDPMKMTADSIKKMDGVGPIVGTLKQFAAAQVAAGMDPKGVQKLVAATLQYAGKTQYLKTALKEIVPATISVGKAQETLLQKLNSATKGMLTEYYINQKSIKNYKDLNSAQKNLADGLGTVALSMTSGIATVSSLTSAMDAFEKSGMDSYTSTRLLQMELRNVGQVDLAKRLGEIQAVVKNTGTAMLIASAQAAGLAQNLDKAALSALANDPVALEKLKKDLAKRNADLAAANKKLGLDAMGNPLVPDPASTTYKTFTGTAEQKAAKKIIEAKVHSENSILKTLKDQLSVQQKQSAEAKRQLDYDMQRQDLSNQMKTSLISGDYLGAAQLKQASSALTIDFNQGTKEQKAQDQIDKIQARTDIFSNALADLNDAIANGVKTLNKSVISAKGLETLTTKNTAGPTTISVVNNITLPAGSTQATASAAAAGAHQGTTKAILDQKNNKTNLVKVGGK